MGEAKATRREPRRIRAYELQHREQVLLGLLHLYPNQIIRGLAKRPEAEWHFGRLYLIGAITRMQYDAASYLDRVTRAYEKMLRLSGDLHSPNLEKTGGSPSEDLSLSAQKKMKKAKKRYDEVYEVLAQCGDDVYQAVVDTLRKDAVVDLTLVTRGLTVIAAGVHSRQRG